jgi:hypothetical protein
MLHDFQVAGRRLTLRGEDKNRVKIVSKIEVAKQLGETNISSIIE